MGPVWSKGGKEKEKSLANCYNNSLLLAVKNEIRTIAFPNISTGIYRFPKKLAAQIAIQTIKEFESQKSIEEVIFVCFDVENYEIYSKLLKE